MRFRASLLLRAFCVWTFVVWAVLVKNMIENDAGHALSFRLVHIAIAVVSIALGIAVWPLSRRLDTRSEG